MTFCLKCLIFLLKLIKFNEGQIKLSSPVYFPRVNNWETALVLSDRRRHNDAATVLKYFSLYFFAPSCFCERGADYAKIILLSAPFFIHFRTRLISLDRQKTFLESSFWCLVRPIKQTGC